MKLSASRLLPSRAGLVLVVVLAALVVTACGSETTVDAGSDEVTVEFLDGAEMADRREDFDWPKCPEVPVFDRNLALVAGETGAATPEMAVDAVMDGGIEVVDVSVDGARAYAEVQVQDEDDSGVFYVEKRASGWLVRGGEGCAAWPAAEQVLGY